MGRVEIYWYMLDGEKGIGLRKHATAKIIPFKQDRQLQIDPGKVFYRMLASGTYIDYDDSDSLETLAKRWFQRNATEQHGLVKAVKFGEYLRSRADLKFEWDEASLDALKAHIAKLPLEYKKDKRKKGYSRALRRYEEACERKRYKSISAEDGDKGISNALEKMDRIQSSIRHLNRSIDAEYLKIEEKIGKYNEVHGEGCIEYGASTYLRRAKEGKLSTRYG